MCSDVGEVEVDEYETRSTSFDQDLDTLYGLLGDGDDTDVREAIEALIAGTAGCRS